MKELGTNKLIIYMAKGKSVYIHGDKIELYANDVLKLTASCHMDAIDLLEKVGEAERLLVVRLDDLSYVCSIFLINASKPTIGEVSEETDIYLNLIAKVIQMESKGK